MGKNEDTPDVIILGRTNGAVLKQFHSELMTQPQRFIRVCSPHRKEVVLLKKSVAFEAYSVAT